MENETHQTNRTGDKARSKATTANAHDTRESWLRSAIRMVEPMFAEAGSPLPDLRRAAIGFTSRGRKGNCLGECWHGDASSDHHVEIFIRPDIANPTDVLGVLVHELVHAACPLGSGHGPVYKALALKVGLEGKMRQALPGMHLAEKLKTIAADLGPFPHAALDISFRESAPRKKQKTNMLKAWCEGGTNKDGEEESCDYVVRLTKLHAERGAPFCGIHDKRMKVEWPEEEEQDEAAEEAPEESFKAPQGDGSAPIWEEATGGFKAPPPAETAMADAAEEDDADPFPVPLKRKADAQPASPQVVTIPEGATVRINLNADGGPTTEVTPPPTN